VRLVSLRRGGVAAVDGDALRVLGAPSMLAWLAGEGRAETGEELPLDGTPLAAPVPEPPSFRDFYAFEGHASTGAALRGVELAAHWYEAPVFYFSNPASIVGPGEPIARPEGSAFLDFELEIAAVIGADGDIAGFTLLNDWSARDIQRAEMAVGLGPSKGKDFATSLGPWLVTPDELPYEDGRLRLEATVVHNGTELTRSDASAQHHAWPAILAHAARGTRLRPGDVLGSGTLNRGCLLELGPDRRRRAVRRARRRGRAARRRARDARDTGHLTRWTPAPPTGRVAGPDARVRRGRRRLAAGLRQRAALGRDRLDGTGRGGEQRVGVTLLLVLGIGSGALRRALGAVRAGARPRAWHYMGGPGRGGDRLRVRQGRARGGGGAAHRGARVRADHRQPGGRRRGAEPGRAAAGHPRPPWSASRSRSWRWSSRHGARGGDLDLVLLFFAVLTGAAIAAQQAANGHIAALTGQPLAAASSTS
jgi:fumarylacetoacetate (FAA) hydrolase